MFHIAFIHLVAHCCCARRPFTIFTAVEMVAYVSTVIGTAAVCNSLPCARRCDERLEELRRREREREYKELLVYLHGVTETRQPLRQALGVADSSGKSELPPSGRVGVGGDLPIQEFSRTTENSQSVMVFVIVFVMILVMVLFCFELCAFIFRMFKLSST